MVVVSYNFEWVTKSTGEEVMMKITTSQGAASSVIPAIFNLFTFTSSLYHLLYMGMQRLHAVAWPINYKFQSKASLYQGLAVVWILAAVSASLPGEGLHDALINFCFSIAVGDRMILGMQDFDCAQV